MIRLPEWTIGVELESAKMAHGNEIIHRLLTPNFILESDNIVPKPQLVIAKTGILSRLVLLRSLAAANVFIVPRALTS